MRGVGSLCVKGRGDGVCVRVCVEIRAAGRGLRVNSNWMDGVRIGLYVCAYL